MEVNPMAYCIFIFFLWIFIGILLGKDDNKRKNRKTMSNNDIDYPEARIVRSNALKWWATLTTEDRRIYTTEYYGEERNPMSLTGREVEKMYVESKS